MFKFKGISSDSMNVIVEEETNIIKKAAQKTEKIDIDGRNGSIYNELGYDDVDFSLKLSIIDISKIDDIFKWLNGKGTFEYNGRITTAYCYTDISTERKATIKSIDVNFTREPFWVKEDDYITVTNSITNIGNILSYPIIKLTKTTSDKVDITINGVRFIYNFDTDYVEIDCKEFNASYNGISKNRNLEIDFEFPKLNPGENTITINSGTAKIEINRKDCWL